MTAKKQKQPRDKSPRKISRQYLENAALYYLQRYATSAANFRRVMKRKIDRSCTFHKVSAEEFYPVLDEMIARYERAGLLNDGGFAVARVSSLRRQGRSKQAITAKLQAKGLGREVIAAALSGVDGEDAELTAAREFARRKKLGPWRKKPLADPKDAQKEMAAMGRAGYSFELARQVLGAAIDDGD
ncbi:MAG: regulatory protein RecX [Alphaproteobacteria bacterium]